MKTIEARIEIPMGSQNKYEIDEVTGKIKLDRVLYSSAFYPVEYGFIENTLSEDGDPLDILVFTSYPTFPGCYIDTKVIGGMNMIDDDEVDIKIISVNANDPRYEHVKSLEDLPPHLLKELKNFFANYKSMQDKVTIVREFFPAQEAYKKIEEARSRKKM